MGLVSVSKLQARQVRVIDLAGRGLAAKVHLNGFGCRDALRRAGYAAELTGGHLPQPKRAEAMRKMRAFCARVLVSTDLVARGVDLERVNLVVNYDMPDGADTYLHRVGRAGRFGTKGLAITFLSSDEDTAVLDAVHARFEVEIKELPEQIDTSTYMPA